MDTPQDDQSPPSAAMSEQERARAFDGAMVNARASYSKKTVTWFVVVLLLVGISGLIVELLASQGAGTGSPATSTTTSTTTTTLPKVTSSLSHAQTSILGLTTLTGKTAPPVALTTTSGRAWTLASQRGHVVILTFYDAACQDICPVLGEEVRAALRDLGSQASSVRVAIVNTNPHVTQPSQSRAALDVPGLSHFHNVVFLNGPLARLIPVWTDYGITVTASKTSSLVAHNNAIYFVGTTGLLRAKAQPFANESHSGHYSLDAKEVAQFGSALARVTSNLNR